MVPYSTCDVEAWSVFQVIVAEVEVIAVAVTDEITGGTATTLTEVVKVKLADVVVVPNELVDSAA